MNRRAAVRVGALAVVLSACGRNPMQAQPTNPLIAESSKAPIAPIGDALPDGPPAPDFTGGGTWLNSAPLTLSSLRGKVVLVDFWTYGCINCHNTLPALQRWWQQYQAQGLVIIGVHTPEFAAEHETENVRAALTREQISWPIVQDNDYTIWQAYQNRYWPHFYLIDHRGRIIYDHIGEGAYDLTEQKIIAALAATQS